MKSRTFKIVIAAQFDDEQDEADISARVMQALQTEGIPRGRAQVVAMPVTVAPMSKTQLSALN